MARTWGSVGVIRREFEQDFYKRARQLKLKPGAYLAEIMHDAQKSGDHRIGLMSLALLTKAASAPLDDGQQSLPLVVVQRWGPQAIEGDSVPTKQQVEWLDSEVQDVESSHG